MVLFPVEKYAKKHFKIIMPKYLAGAEGAKRKPAIGARKVKPERLKTKSGFCLAKRLEAGRVRPGLDAQGIDELAAFEVAARE